MLTMTRAYTDSYLSILMHDSTLIKRFNVITYQLGCTQHNSLIMNFSLPTFVNSNRYHDMIIFSDYKIQIYKVLFQSYLTVNNEKAYDLLEFCSKIKIEIDEYGNIKSKDDLLS